MTKSMDFERVLLLLEVVERTAQHGQTLNPLRDQAVKELNQIMEDFKKDEEKVVAKADEPMKSEPSLKSKEETATNGDTSARRF